MAEYYMHQIAAWNEGTDNLSLEQEAAYHRVVSMIRLYERPLKHNFRVLGGLWRCNERKAKRLLDELIEAGKLRIEGEHIINDKAVEDASNLRQLRVDRASAGRRGGIESGKSRRKPLENNDTTEAIALTREEKRREEKKKEEETSVSSKKMPAVGKRLLPDWELPSEWAAWATAEGLPDPQAQADRFRDYWIGISGAKGVKLDWQATWRNWVRKAIADGPTKAKGSVGWHPNNPDHPDYIPKDGEEKTGPTKLRLKYSARQSKWMKIEDWKP